MWFVSYLRAVIKFSPTPSIVCTDVSALCQVTEMPFFFFFFFLFLFLSHVSMICDALWSVRLRVGPCCLVIRAMLPVADSQWQNPTRSSYKELWSTRVRLPGIKQGKEGCRMDGSRGCVGAWTQNSLTAIYPVELVCGLVQIVMYVISGTRAVSHWPSLILHFHTNPSLKTRELST